jgi:hypothetical protein
MELASPGPGCPVLHQRSAEGGGNRLSDGQSCRDEIQRSAPA